LPDQTLLEHTKNRFDATDQHFNAYWKDHLNELQRWFNPRRGAFFMSERGKPKPRNHFLNEVAVLARRTSSAGMLAGASSPSRPWIKLNTFQFDSVKHSPLQDWLALAASFVLTVFGRSNLYHSYHSSYDEMLWAGTGPILLQPDFATIVRSQQLTAGSWRIALDSSLRVGTLFYKDSWRLEDIVAQFGRQNVSDYVRNHHERHPDETREVICAITENNDRFSDAGQLFPWRTVYFENDESVSGGSPLSVEGAFDKPFIAPRWFTLGREAMGGAPAMDILGTTTTLHTKELDRNRIVARVADPTMLRPTGVDGSFAPRSIIDVAPDQIAQVTPAYAPTLAGFAELRMDAADAEDRIRHGMYTDLFMLFFNLDRRAQMTVPEVTERASERMLGLGPVLEGLDEEMFEPTVAFILNQGMRGGVIPPPPVPPGEEAPIRVEYDSILSQAQKAVGVGNIDRFIALIGAVGEIKPAALDKMDEDELVDDYADRLGVNPKFVRGPDEVAPYRAERMRREAAAEDMARVEAQASAAQKFANAPLGKGNVIDEVIRGVGGS